MVDPRSKNRILASVLFPQTVCQHYGVLAFGVSKEDLVAGTVWWGRRFRGKNMQHFSPPVVRKSDSRNRALRIWGCDVLATVVLLTFERRVDRGSLNRGTAMLCSFKTPPLLGDFKTWRSKPALATASFTFRGVRVFAVEGWHLGLAMLLPQCRANPACVVTLPPQHILVAFGGARSAKRRAVVGCGPGIVLK